MPLISQLIDICRSSETSEGQFKVVPTFFPIDSCNSIITGENYRPDLLFLIQSKCLYALELTVGFESNLNNNAVRKKRKISELDQRNE